MKTSHLEFAVMARWSALFLAAAALLVPHRAVAVGNWLKLDNQAFDSVALLILLSDGTVMAANNPTSVFGDIGNDWYCLTPDSHGHYLDGKWSRRASMNYTRFAYSAQVLQNGRLFVAGGEYGNGGATAEVFDPVANYWTIVTPPLSLLNPNNPTPEPSTTTSQGFADSESRLLPDGTVLVAPARPGTLHGTLIYDPYANSWSAGAQSAAWQGEASWVKLPDGSILTVDHDSNNSERYIPSPTNPQWVPDANLPVNLWAGLFPVALGEIGPAFLLPNGNAFFLGGSGHTAIYTPSGNASPGKWIQGPDIPTDSNGNQLVAADAPGCMMPNGKILCAVALPPYLDTQQNPQFPSPTSFFEYDYAAGPLGSFTQVGGPTGGLTDNVQSQQCTMLLLPDGGVLYCHFEVGNAFYSGFGSQLYIYAPDGSPPVASGKPTISSVTRNADGSFHLIGTGLNGISEGAAFGDENQMGSNYPLVKFTNLSDGTGNADYGRTYNWSSTGVMTGNTPVTTEFTTSPGLIPDTYALTVIANAISSDPVTFLGPAWVDFNYHAFPENGSFAGPFPSLVLGTNAVPSGGTIVIKGPSINANQGPAVSQETMTITKPMTITAVGGPATIGQ
jgi:hypothetical protein